MSNLLRGHVNPVNKLLIVGISLLRRGQNFREIINWALNFEGLSFLFPLDRKNGTNDLSRGCYVKQQWLFADRSSKAGWRAKLLALQMVHQLLESIRTCLTSSSVG